ncbi:MAG: SUMF1/EgtB/PvdO family nonheme iron enzyme, partial [bacterium]
SRRQETVDGSQKSEGRSRKWPWLVGLAALVMVATVAGMQHYGKRKAGDGSPNGSAAQAVPAAVDVPATQAQTGQAGAAVPSQKETVPAFSSSSTPVSPTADIVTPVSSTQSGQPWTNSLGMVFVTVLGTAVRFSIWDTRVQDFSAFVNDRENNAGYDYRKGSVPHIWILDGGWGERGWEYDWSNPGFEQTPLHPVVCTSWNDAQSFCEWLTAKERREKRLSGQQSYRLPTDAEWSYAVGIGEMEDSGTPKDKNRKVKNVYPWGTQWPTPKGAGNYSSNLHVDDYDFCTAPVGSFAANRYGLYDMGGNVWQWCEDLYDPNQKKNDAQKNRVLRGVSWGGAFDDNSSPHLLSSVRCAFAPEYRDNFQGFRVVLADGSVSAPQVSTVSASTPAHSNNEQSWIVPTLPKPDRDGWITLFDGKHLYGCNSAASQFTSGQVYFKDGYLCVNDAGFSFDWKGQNATIRARVKKINGKHVALHIGPCFAWYGSGVGISQNVSGRDRAPILISRKLMSKTPGFVDLELSLTGSQLEFKFNGAVVLTKQALPFEKNEKSVQVSTWKGLSQFERIEVKVMGE